MNSLHRRFARAASRASATMLASQTTTMTAMTVRLPHYRPIHWALGVSTGALLLAACGDRSATTTNHVTNGADKDAAVTATIVAPARMPGSVVTVRDTVVAGVIDASALVEPIRQATLSTKLMGTVTDVLVHEGDVVRAGQAVLHIDARDLTAKAEQVAAGIADAEAMQRDAAVQAKRIRALYADSAATRAQLDGVETALARTDAALRAARAASGELAAMQSYATVRAPFDAVVTRRLVDPGAFAAPGAPLITVQDVSSLRISATVAADGLRTLRRGQTVGVTIDGAVLDAVLEGVVPANAGNLFTINVTLSNRRGTLRAGSAAVVHVPSLEHHALLVPSAALIREGDLTGVIVRGTLRDERRWIRIGTEVGTLVDVTSGLQVGDQVVVAPSGTSTVPPAIPPAISPEKSASSRKANSSNASSPTPLSR